MSFFARLSIILIIGIMFLPGCATNRQRYEMASYDVGVISKEQDVEEVSFEQLDKVSPGERPAIETDEAGLWMLVDQVEEQLKTSGNVVHDEKLNNYLKDITCRLAPDYCSDIRIYLIQHPDYNAFIAPNGAMIVWTGLLLRTENEAQLAAVMGHEIGHYLRRHLLQKMKLVMNVGGPANFAKSVALASGFWWTIPAINSAAIGGFGKSSRDMEREADGYGIALMARAGYDPREYAKMWSSLNEEVKVDKDHKNQSVFFASHPKIMERQKSVKEIGQKIVERGGTYSSEEARFRENILPHLMEYLRDELNLKNFEKNEWLIDSLIKRGNNRGELHFIKGEFYRQRGEEGDNKKALQEYEDAVNTGSPPPETFRAMGILFVKEDMKEKAVNAFKTYLECCTKPKDEKMILSMIREMEQ